MSESGYADFVTGLDEDTYASARARRASLIGGVLLIAAGVSGCAASVGFGAPTLTSAEADAVVKDAAAIRVNLSGSIGVDRKGCFNWVSVDTDDPLNGSWIVWPDGTRQEDDELVLPSGKHLGAGDTIVAAGAPVVVANLPLGTDDQSYFGSFGPFCDADDHGVLVVTEVAQG